MGLNPSVQQYRDHRVDDLIAMGEYSRALADIDTLIENGYRVETEYEKKALILLEMNDLEGALAQLDSALVENPTSSIAYDLRGVIYLKSNRNEEAVEALVAAGDRRFSCIASHMKDRCRSGQRCCCLNTSFRLRRCNVW